MSERGQFASVVAIDKETGLLVYYYVYYSTHRDIYPAPDGVVLNGSQNANALIQNKADVSFLSSYQSFTQS